MANPINEIMPPHFLMPFCTELKTDGFFCVLKCIINRSSIDDFFDKPLKSAMRGEEFSVESEDLIINWSMRNSQEQRVRQYKLLGYWAIQNFGCFGRTLLGKTWKAPERKSIAVVGPSGTEHLQPEEIDEKIFLKLGLRILEINVSSSTLAKLVNFVKVPVTIERKNELKMSPKMKSFDIDNKCMEKCWRALRSGAFDVSCEESGSSTSAISQPDDLIHQALSLDAPFDNQEVGLGEHQENSVDDFQSVVARKRKRICNHNDGGERLNGDSSDDSLRTVMLEMQNDIKNLTKWFDPETTLLKSSHEPFHVMILKQKDAEIDKLKASEHQLRQKNQSLVNQLEEKTVAINSLQEEVDASSMSKVKCETDLVACQNMIESMKIEVADRNGIEERNVQLDNQVRELTENLAETIKKNVDIESMNSTLRDAINQWKDYTEKQSTELIAAKNSLGRYTRIQEELKAMKNYASSVESEMRSEINKLDEELTSTVKAHSESLDQKEKLQTEVTVLQNQVRELTDNLAETRKQNVVIETKNASVQEELKEMKENASRVETEMKSKINKLQEKLTATANAHSQILDQKERLQHEVNDLKEKHVNNRTPAGTQTDACNEMERHEFEPNDILRFSSASIQQTNIRESEPFVSDDPIVSKCRDGLQKLQFGWVKFADKRNAKYCPAFVHPPEAQRVTQDGYVTSKKYRFFDFKYKVDEKDKENTGRYALKKFNNTFKLNYF